MSIENTRRAAERSRAGKVGDSLIARLNTGESEKDSRFAVTFELIQGGFFL